MGKFKIGFLIDIEIFNFFKKFEHHSSPPNYQKKRIKGPASKTKGIFKVVF